MSQLTATAQVIDLSQSGPAGTAFKWSGPGANAGAGASLTRGDLSGDVDRLDLIVGSPGAGPHGEGQAFVVFMGPTRSGTVNLSGSDVVLTGAAAGDQFGKSTSTGSVIRREVTPLPPRDLIVSAPAAHGGNGAVYMFTGPFSRGDVRSAASATLTIIGASGDHLGVSVVASDIDGDGYRDILMTAPNTGRVYIIFGGPSLSGTYDLGSRGANVTLTVPSSISALVSADLNNDGFKDIVVGSAAGAGTVFVVAGRARSAFAASMPMGSAGVQFTGTAAGDAAGSTLEVADVDADGTSDLIVGAPNSNGPSGNRADAGAAYVLFGSSSFMRSRSLSASDVTIYGAAVGHHLGSAMSHGTVRRQLQDDLVLLAPGASAAGDVDVVYGHPRSLMPSTIDLAAGADRVLRGDASGPAITTIVTVEITGEGAEDIVAGVPNASNGAAADAGLLYAVYSPTLKISAPATALTVAQGSTATVTLSMRNTGTLNVAWGARSNSPWLALSPTTGTASAVAPGPLTLTIAPGALAPGVYHGALTYASVSPHLVWADIATVDLTVTNGTPTDPAPTNPFGVPDSPDEGSPNGVPTPTGTDVTVVPISDFLVRFTNVTVAGRTTVTVTSSTGSQLPLGAGVRYGDWFYKVSTTAQFAGPVTIAVAYRDFAPQSQGAIRLHGSKDISAWTDLSRHVVWGSNAKLGDTFYVALSKPTITSLSYAPSPVSAGSTVRVTATANGSGGVLAYRFWRRDGTIWSIVQDYSPSNSYSWVTAPADAGSHSMSVWVRRADSTADYDTWSALDLPVSAAQPLRVTGVVPSESIPAPAGRALTFTASSAGGIGPISYQFWRLDHGAWTMVQDYSPSNVYTWPTTASDMGAHSLSVWAKSANSTASFDAWLAASFNITAPAPLVVKSLSSSVPLPTPAGTTITFTAQTSGGVGPLQYKFWRLDGNTWNMVQDYGPNASYTWATGGGDTGTHQLSVWVRNAGSTAAYDAYVASGFISITAPPSAQLLSLTTNVPLPVQAGSWITWTALARSTGGPIEYKFFRYDAPTGWSVAQNWGPANAYTWPTAAADFGTHAVSVWARRVGSTANYESYLVTGYFTITGPSAVTMKSVASNVSLPASAGSTIRWTASAKGGYGPLQYRFWLFNGATGTWSIVQDYSSANTLQWTTTAADAGTHQVSVWVKQPSSTAPYDSWMATPAFVIKP